MEDICLHPGHSHQVNEASCGPRASGIGCGSFILSDDYYIADCLGHTAVDMDLQEFVVLSRRSYWNGSRS